MNVPVWSVVTWTPVLVSLAEFNRSLSRFSQLTLAKHHGHPESGADYGQVLWTATVDKRLVGMAWDWAAVAKGAVAMTDPLNILSNIVLYGRDRRILSDDEQKMHFATAVHGLPWQTHVLNRDEPLQLSDGHAEAAARWHSPMRIAA